MNKIPPLAALGRNDSRVGEHPGSAWNDNQRSALNDKEKGFPINGINPPEQARH